MLIPTVRCSRIQDSIHFYTQLLDFELAEDASEATDPAFVALKRGSAFLFLSSHSGDGVPGQAVSIVVDRVDALFRVFQARGLETPGHPQEPTEVHEGPIDQSWGTREFYVKDPDGNTLRYIEGFNFKS